MGAITFRNVCKDFPRQDGQRLRVLENVNCEIADGTFTSVLGLSGCGKSTILNLIAGLERPASGEVIIEGRRMGFVFQQPRLLNWRTVRENVALPLEQSDIDKTGRRALATKYLDLV